MGQNLMEKAIDKIKGETIKNRRENDRRNERKQNGKSKSCINWIRVNGTSICSDA